MVLKENLRTYPKVELNFYNPYKTKTKYKIKHYFTHEKML